MAFSVSVRPAFCFVSVSVPSFRPVAVPMKGVFSFRPLSAQERTGTNSRPQGTKRGHGGLLKRLGNETEGRGGEGGHPHFVISEQRGPPIPHFVLSEFLGARGVFLSLLFFPLGGGVYIVEKYFHYNSMRNVRSR